jgi:hypothetical protein
MYEEIKFNVKERVHIAEKFSLQLDETIGVNENLS